MQLPLRSYVFERGRLVVSGIGLGDEALVEAWERMTLGGVKVEMRPQTSAA